MRDFSLAALNILLLNNKSQAGLKPRTQETLNYITTFVSQPE